MNTGRQIGLLIVAVQLIVGCSTTPDSQIDVVAVWMCPVNQTPYYRADGEGPYAPSWPTAAVICRNAPRAQGAQDRTLTHDGTLFLLSAPDLTSGNVVHCLPHAARFASSCFTDARGHWLRLSPLREPLFVLVHESGGTAGLIVRVFDHSIIYDHPDHHGPGAWQSHSFAEVFDDNSRLPPLAGDVNGDGRMELLLANDAGNIQKPFAERTTYQVFAWDDTSQKLALLKELDVTDVKRLKGLTDL